MTLRMLALSILVATTATAAPSASTEQKHDWDVAQLAERFLVDVTCEKRPFDGSVIVNLRTIGPSHDCDARTEFPRNDI